MHACMHAAGLLPATPGAAQAVLINGSNDGGVGSSLQTSSMDWNSLRGGAHGNRAPTASDMPLLPGPARATAFCKRGSKGATRALLCSPARLAFLFSLCTALPCGCGHEDALFFLSTIQNL